MSLVKQTSIYFAANALSAAFGLLNVVIFTRWMTAVEYGVYIIGVALAAVLGTLLFTWLRQAIVRQESKADGTDMRATVLLGFVGVCIPIPFIVLAAGHFLSFDQQAVPAGVLLAVSVGFFELSVELLRARQRSQQVLFATLVRAALVTLLGIGVLYFNSSGQSLLISGAVAYLASSALILREVWGASRIDFSSARLRYFIIWGMPLTLSIGLLAFAGTTDRFLVAYVIGARAAGQYGASVDLVRQALIIPAISASAAFVPIAVNLLAREGKKATRVHLEKCLELLLAITLPCCIGFALLAPRIGNLVLGEEFREVAASIMPIIAIAVVFQIFVHQYLHISFFLSSQNRFYLINTVITLIIGTALSFVLIEMFGIAGAAWGRVASEIIGMLSALWLARSAFSLPFPMARAAKVAIAVILMTIVILLLNPLFRNSDKTALAILIPLGAAIYVVTCWFLDVGDIRNKLGRLASATGAWLVR